MPPQKRAGTQAAEPPAKAAKVVEDPHAAAPKTVDIIIKASDGDFMLLKEAKIDLAQAQRISERVKDMVSDSGDATNEGEDGEETLAKAISIDLRGSGAGVPTPNKAGVYLAVLAAKLWVREEELRTAVAERTTQQKSLVEFKTRQLMLSEKHFSGEDVDIQDLLMAWVTAETLNIPHDAVKSVLSAITFKMSTAARGGVDALRKLLNHPTDLTF